MQIDVDEKVAHALNALQSQAAKVQMPFDAYLRQFVDHLYAINMNGALSLEDFDRILDELSASMQAPVSLPDRFSRADIYADHD